jgi:hypothetical protein
MTVYPDQTVGAVVTNAGGGVARGAGIVLTHPPYFVEGPIGHGFMYPGDTKHVFTTIPVVDPEVTTCVIAQCRDQDSFPHGWSAHEKHKVFRTWRRCPRYQNIRDIHAHFYPGIDFDALTQVEMRVVDDKPGE